MDYLTLITNIFLIVIGLIAIIYASREWIFKTSPQKYLSPIKLYPKIINEKFQGRKSEILILKKHLVRFTFFKRKPVIISGLAGIGKTSLALKFADKYKSKFGHILWISVENLDSRKNSIINIGNSFSQQGYIGYGDNAQLCSIKPHKKPTLLILDNLDHPPVGLADIRIIQNARVVVTSQLSKWDDTHKIIFLKSLTLEESINFLERVTKLNDPDGAKILAEELGGHPLAISHAAYTILESGNWNYQLYKNKFYDRIKNMPLQTDYNKSIYATFQTALESAGFKEVSENSTIKILAFANPDNVDLNFLNKLSKNTFNEILSDEVIAGLEKRSLINKAINGVFSIHRVVQNVIANSISIDEIEKICIEVIKISEAENINMFSSQKDYIEAQPVLQAVNRMFELSIPISDNIANLFNMNISATMQWGDRNLVSKKIDKVKPYLANNSVPKELRASIMANIGAYYQLNNEQEKAINILSDSVKLTRKLLSNSKNNSSLRKELSARLNNLARSIQFLGQIDNNKTKYLEAEPLFLEALKIDVSESGKNSIKSGQRLNNLSALYCDIGDLDKAIEYAHKSLDVTLKALNGNMDAILLIRFYNLSRYYFEIKDFRNAEKFALEMWGIIKNHQIQDEKKLKALSKCIEAFKSTQNDALHDVTDELFRLYLENKEIFNNSLDLQHLKSYLFSHKEFVKLIKLIVWQLTFKKRKNKIIV